jgi:hypothetical protein
MAPLPAFISTATKGFVGGSLAAGAVTAINALINNAPNRSAPNLYTANNLVQFPYDLPVINGQTFCILFQFYQYNRPSILVPPTLTPFGAIALPIPADMLDQSAASYSEEGSDLMVGAALENFSGSVAGAISSVSAALSASGIDAVNKIATNIGDPNAANKVLQMTGVAQNPFLSVLFNAPTFKRHIFSWTFIPESQQDTENLNFILNKFRYHSMPDVLPSTGGLMLTYPDMCIPKIIPSGYLYDFKQCVIESMVINYAPGDTPAFTPKNAPNAVKFTVKLLEIEYWVKSDLLNASGGPATSDFGTSTTSTLYGPAKYGSSA